MKIPYFFIAAITLNPPYTLFASEDDLKDEPHTILSQGFEPENSPGEQYHKYLNSYSDKYELLSQKPVLIKPSKNKHKHYMRLCDFENDRTLEIEDLGKGLSHMTAIKQPPHADMSMDELKLYTDFGSSKQRLEVAMILIARDEIDEALTWEFLAHPLPKLSPYDLYYGHMLIHLIDYAFLHKDKALANSLLQMLETDLKLRLKNWAFGSQDYLKEIGYEYLDRVRRILNEQLFDGEMLKAINLQFLKDKKWRKIGRQSIELLKTQVDTVSLMLEQAKLERQDSGSGDNQEGK